MFSSSYRHGHPMLDHQYKTQSCAFRCQLCLGVFATKNEAIEAYDDALCREAVKQRSSVLRMPKKRCEQIESKTDPITRRTQFGSYIAILNPTHPSQHR